MKLTRILQNGNQIAPQTLDKAVLVRVFDTTTTLDKVLLTKVDSVKNTDTTLNIIQKGTEVTINHLTNVTPNVDCLGTIYLVRGSDINQNKYAEYICIFNNAEY